MNEMTNKIILGVDIDGCLNNFQKTIRTLIHRDFGIDIDDDDYCVTDCLNLSKQDLERFWEHYSPIILDNTDAEENAAQILMLLKEKYNINIITARGYDVADLTQTWIDNHCLYYDNLLFNTGNKFDACNWIGAKTMIEDSPYNAYALMKHGVHVLLFDRPYNRDIKNGELLTRVYSWDNIYDILK